MPIFRVANRVRCESMSNKHEISPIVKASELNDYAIDNLSRNILIRESFYSNSKGNIVKITPINAFTDNYIWALHNDQHCVVVDPGDPVVVLAFLKAHNLQLSAILITHHHFDHTGGISELTKHYPHITVFGPSNPNIKGITHSLEDTDTLYLDEIKLELSVMTVPGHTLDHIMYFAPGMLFCGDTLFSCGCGRLFEGTPAQMFDSLRKISQLPRETLIYCTHEYTQANIAFAETVEPHNKALAQYKLWVEQQLSNNKPTIPTLLSEQLQFNPFLRVHDDSVQAFAHSIAGDSRQKTVTDPVQVFAALRLAKDDF
jgi:hydroxyacylglutathione hydrolase